MITPEIRAEMRNVIRCFDRYDHDTRAMMASSHRLGFRQRHRTGEFYYVHPAVPGRGFPTRSRAARAALDAAQGAPDGAIPKDLNDAQH